MTLLATVPAPAPLPERMRRAAERAGLGPDDPLTALVEAMGEAAQGARVLSPEAEAELVQRVARSAGAATSQAMEDQASASLRATALLNAAVLAGMLGLGTLGGWWAGTRQPVATALGPMAPATAAVLAANPLDQALAECRGANVWRDRGTGRQVCAVRLWLDPAPAAAPAR